MNISLLSIGGRMPGWVAEGFAEYANRMPANVQVQLVELPLGLRGKGDPGRALQQEGARMLKAVPPGAHVVALDPPGRTLTTEQLSLRLGDWLQQGRPVALLVGGPDGLAAECRARADESWSLSRLTFPHMLVRVLVAEQLYRAWTILQNHPYHR
jgi:23S rRNA (pseudouridine1915-N3)-methyltransferase